MSTAPLKITVTVGKYTEGQHPALMLPVFQGAWKSDGVYAAIDRMSPVAPADLMASGEIRGDFREFTILHLPKGSAYDRVVMIGAGKEQDFCIDRLRSISAKASRTLRRLRCQKMVVVADAFPQLEADIVGQAVTEGTIMGLYRFKKMTAEPAKDEKFRELVFLARDAKQAAAIKAGVARGEILANATTMVRDMANEPGNIRTPRSLGDTALEIAKRRKLACKVFDEKALEKMGMGGILAVGKGSAEPPRLISLRYDGGGKDAPTIALVGKGITFDSGGISIKPSSGMHQMKYDMSGAAAVLGALDAIAQLKPKVNVIGIVVSAENMPDARAYKPGDVVKMYGDKYVEIINTDAEGRMLLADGLVYAAEQGADLVVDIATLTGGVVVALGHIASGVMGNNQWLVDHVIQAGRDVDERVWQMPLFPEYLVQIRSSTADLVNSGGAPASAITAAMFLKQFVDGPAWAHLDIAGTAWIEEDTTLYFHKPYLPKKGATGVGVRSLTRLAEIVAEATGGKKAALKKSLGPTH